MPFLYRLKWIHCWVEKERTAEWYIYNNIYVKRYLCKHRGCLCYILYGFIDMYGEGLARAWKIHAKNRNSGSLRGNRRGQGWGPERNIYNALISMSNLYLCTTYVINFHFNKCRDGFQNHWHISSSAVLWPVLGRMHKKQNLVIRHPDTDPAFKELSGWCGGTGPPPRGIKSWWGVDNARGFMLGGKGGYSHYFRDQEGMATKERQSWAWAKRTSRSK